MGWWEGRLHCLLSRQIERTSQKVRTDTQDRLPKLDWVRLQLIPGHSEVLTGQAQRLVPRTAWSYSPGVTRTQGHHLLSPENPVGTCSALAPGALTAVAPWEGSRGLDDPQGGDQSSEPHGDPPGALCRLTPATETGPW